MAPVRGSIVDRHHPWNMLKGAQSITHVFDVTTDQGAAFNICATYMGPYYTATDYEGRYNLDVKVFVNGSRAETASFNAHWGFGARFHEWREKSLQFTWEGMQMNLSFSVVSRMVFWSPRLELEHAKLTVGGNVLMSYTSHADSSDEWLGALVSGLTVGFKVASHVHS